MTRKPLLALIATLFVTTVAIGLIAATRAPGASAGVAAVAGPACLTDDLTGTLIGQPGRPGAGVRDAVLRLTNTSGRACQVRGWAELAMVTPPGELVRVPTRKVGQAGGEIVLRPEGSAWSKVQWDTCDPAGARCGVGVALQYLVDPDSTGTVADLTAVPEADRAGITMRALRVGPLQPTRAAALG
jgi:hypothetical protein